MKMRFLLSIFLVFFFPFLLVAKAPPEIGVIQRAGLPPVFYSKVVSDSEEKAFQKLPVLEAIERLKDFRSKGETGKFAGFFCAYCFKGFPQNELKGFVDNIFPFAEDELLWIENFITDGEFFQAKNQDCICNFGYEFSCLIEDGIGEITLILLSKNEQLNYKEAVEKKQAGDGPIAKHLKNGLEGKLCTSFGNLKEKILLGRVREPKKKIEIHTIEKGKKAN